MRVLLYLSLIAGEWALVFYLRRRLRPTTLRDLIGGDWRAPARVTLDLALAAGLWLAWKLIVLGLAQLPYLAGEARVGGMLPRGPLEIAVWIPLSLTAGFCEELIFRGWLQRLFTARTRSAGLGVLLQALVFGALHAYEGAAASLRIVCFGLLFGLVALWRRSLRPGMIAHAATDVLSGIFHA